MANGNAYPAVMLDPDGNPDSAAVTLQFTDSTDQPGTGGGGGGGQSGDGSPVGVVTPAGIGGQYTDTTNGALYIATGATDADWVLAAGNSQTGTDTGVVSSPGAVILNDGSGGSIELSGGISLQPAATGNLAVINTGLQATAIAVSDDSANTLIGFYGATAVEQPQVPGTPLPQDIVDALVALGLVSQA